MEPTLLSLRSFLTPNEQELARRWHAHTASGQRRDLEREAWDFYRRMRITRGNGRVVLARARTPDGTGFWAGLPTQSLLSTHSWVTGGTGSGKSYWILGCLLQVLAQGMYPVVVFDMKGELSELLTSAVLPSLAKTNAGSKLLTNLRIVQPFDRRFVPELNITLAEEGVPREIQAFSIASAIEDGLGEDLRARMGRVIFKAIPLAIELNLPLIVLQEWLEQPQAFARDARRSADPSIRQYVTGAFLREPRSSVDALLARLDTFLFLPEMRLALSTPGCLSFPQCFERGLTVINLGAPPAGAERVARFLAGILLGRLTRAILSRRLHERSRQCWIVFEEFQETVLSGKQTEQFSRLLALIRWKLFGCAFLNQAPGQLDPALVKLLRTNTGIEVAFRSSFEDARAIAHALPVSPDPKAAKAERQAVLEAIPRMPTRAFYLWIKDADFRAQKVRSPRLDLSRLRAAGDDIPDDIRAFLERGIAALPRKQVEDALRRASDGKRPSERTFLDVAAEDRDRAFPGLG